MQKQHILTLLTIFSAVGSVIAADSQPNKKEQASQLSFFMRSDLKGISLLLDYVRCDNVEAVRCLLDHKEEYPEFDPNKNAFHKVHARPRAHVPASRVSIV